MHCHICRHALFAVLLSLAPGGLLHAAGAPALAAGETAASTARSSGTVVREGDILTYAATDTQLRGVAGRSVGLWPDGIVPVWIEPSLPIDGIRTIREAMQRWNAVAGIRFDELLARPGKGVDHVRFEPGEGCASWVGRRGGGQSLWVAPVCNVGSVMHELGHALGLEHEHTRPDRDAWIAIHWDSVLPDKRHNFDRAPDEAPMLGDYDYASIMHYGPDFFSADGSATIEPLIDTAVRIGQRDAPSAGDIAAIAELYGTDLSVSAELFATAQSSATTTTGTDVRPSHDLEVFVTNEGRRGAHDVLVTVDLAGDWRSIGQHVAVDAWRCEADAAAIHCRLDRLAAGTGARLSLALLDSDSNAGAAPAHRVRIWSGSDDANGANDLQRVQRISDGERTSGDWIILADGSSAGDGTIRTGNGLGGTHPAWSLFAALTLLLRRVYRRRE